jgi:DNA-binding NtrC family response regulator
LNICPAFSKPENGFGKSSIFTNSRNTRMSDKKTILIIEDEKNQRFLFHEELLDEGYKVLACPNAIEALDELEKCTVDLILTDVRLPGGDATAFIPHIRNSHFNTPVVVVSGYEVYGDYLLRHEPMVKAFFKKPVDLKSMKQTIAEILQKQAVAQKS